MYYLTQNGKTLIENEIKSLFEELLLKREEKNLAYTASGDTWHDNPTFNRLEQEESYLGSKIAEKQQILSSAKILIIDVRDLNKVTIGSIVKVKIYFLKNSEEKVETWEIVGYGESSPKDKKIAYNTPLAQTIINLKVGQSKTIEDKQKGKIRYEIIDLLQEF